MSNPYNKYKKTSVMSASREQILLMLYEGAIRFTKLAIQAVEENKIADRGQNIVKAYDIILELQISLDHKIGGELSVQLDQLYVFVLEQLTKANLTGDKAALEGVVKILENLYDGWKQAIEQGKKNNDQKRGVA